MNPLLRHRPLRISLLIAGLSAWPLGGLWVWSNWFAEPIRAVTRDQIVPGMSRQAVVELCGVPARVIPDGARECLIYENPLARAIYRVEIDAGRVTSACIDD